MLSKAEFRGVLLAVAGFVSLLLLIISWSPGLPGELLLQSLRFHVLAAGIVVLVALVAFGARWRGLLYGLVLVVGAAHAGYVVWQLYAWRTPMAGQPVAQFQLMSSNTLTGNRSAEQLVQAVLADPPDIVVFEETPGIEQYLDQLGTAFPHRLGCDRSASCDISLFSRLPIVDGGVLLLPPFNRERLIWARVEVDGQPVTIVGAHLSKPYFDEASWEELFNIGRFIMGLEGPVVLAGDFNAAAWSEPLAMLVDRLQLSPGPSMPATWPVRAGMLGVPIDNMFTRGQARILDIASGADSHGSNHRPLIATIGLYTAP